MKLLNLLLLVGMAVNPVFAQETKLHPDVIEKITGLKGTLNEKEHVFKVSYPRTDLRVMSAGVTMTPAMGLTAWAAFTPVKDQVMVMGDIVMLEDEVNPVMSAALKNGLEVTALHNHFFYETPKIMFMHISGMGSEEKIAGAVGKVFETLKAPVDNSMKFEIVAIKPADTHLDSKKISDILGYTGELKDGVYKVTVGATTQMHGASMGGAMGVNTWAAFAGTDAKAVVDGDFAMKESELQAVLKALREANIGIVAIHNHMTGEKPRLVFLHYWGVGTTVDLAKGLKSALLTQGK